MFQTNIEHVCRLLSTNRLPELPPVVDGTDVLFNTDKLPSFAHANSQTVVSGGLRICTETDSSIQQHIDKLIQGK
jgi:hypothetical protein